MLGHTLKFGRIRDFRVTGVQGYSFYVCAHYPKFAVPSSGKTMSRKRARFHFEVQERYGLPLSPCQVWWARISRAASGRKSSMFLPAALRAVHSAGISVRAYSGTILRFFSPQGRHAPHFTPVGEICTEVVDQRSTPPRQLLPNQCMDGCVCVWAPKWKSYWNFGIYTPRRCVGLYRCLPNFHLLWLWSASRSVMC